MHTRHQNEVKLLTKPIKALEFLDANMKQSKKKKHTSNISGKYNAKDPK